MSRFKRAERKKLKLRLALDGPSGSGKTYTALRFAFALGQRVAVIDTEHRSASKYQGEDPDGRPWEFDTLELDHYAPTEYTAAIEEAGREGHDVLIIDSLSHAWSGEGGALELKDQKEAKGGNSFTAWKTITPMHNRMVEAILKAPLHVIATMRTKMEYVLEPDDKGRMVPKKIGMAPIQRAGIEYEFDVVADLDLSNILTVSKTRCPALNGLVAAKPSIAWMEPVVRWLDRGIEPPPAPVPSPKRPHNPCSGEQVARLFSLVESHGWALSKVQAKLMDRFGVPIFEDLSAEEADELTHKWSQPANGGKS